MIPATLRDAFRDPPREFGAMPFWFWNDDLEPIEIRRQIREFHAKGFGGFIPHARVGLSRRVGYLTDEWFRMARVAVEEAARLDMNVVLYDEGSYPSGSACGRVVAENPDYAARCLTPVTRTVEGPATGYWRPNPGRALTDRLIAVVLVKELDGDRLDGATLRRLAPESDGRLVRYDVPDGRWRLISVWDAFSGGTIRGVHEEEEDGSALAPPAGNILDPESVACFIRHTHDRYYEHLGEFFGSTIIAMFTDEPNPLGRGVRRSNARPYTPGLLEEAQVEWDDDVRRWLPALWFDCGERTDSLRRVFGNAVHRRLERVFYAAQSRWCETRGIALTGHPERSDEMNPLRLFHMPGQDIVWRYVVPGDDTALEGAHSVAAKVAHSAAVLADRRRNASEPLGAYGWRLTLDEAKWLVDWHTARGTNLFYLHAAFYSIRGRRAYESEPDLTVHNVWWRHFDLLADPLRRTCWALTDAAEVCAAAVLVDGSAVSWRAAKELLTGQTMFAYLNPETLRGARVDDGSLRVGRGAFRVVVCDAPDSVVAGVRAELDALSASGGVVIESWEPGTLAGRVAEAVGRRVAWGGSPDLRVFHVRRGDCDFYHLVNEGEKRLEGTLSLAAVGSAEIWDPTDGSTGRHAARVRAGRLETALALERRQSLFLVVDAAGSPDPTVPAEPVPGDAVCTLDAEWEIERETDGVRFAGRLPLDWARVGGWETFSGTATYRAAFDLPSDVLERGHFLDLGVVGDIAEVALNGEIVGRRAWPPYRFDAKGKLKATNRLEVSVTNSMANAMDGAQLPSGVLGPVRLLTAI